MKKVLFTGDTLTDEARASLKERGYEFIPAPYDLPASEVAARLKECDGYILGGDEIANAEMLERAGDKLKAISFFGAGYEKYIDVSAATKKGIVVANTPAANADSVAEFTVALIMAAVKDIPQNNQAIKAGNWSRPMTFDLKGKTIGIIGLGNVGERVTKILSAGFGAKIIYTSRSSKPNIENAYLAKMVSLDELLRSSDIITIHASLNDETRGLIGEHEFATMKSNAIIIDTARVEIIDERALVKALKEGKIAKCAFDGFYEEPVDADVVARHELLSLGEDKFIVTPHMAYYTSDAINKMEQMAVDNIIQILSGLPCANVVGK